MNVTSAWKSACSLLCSLVLISCLETTSESDDPEITNRTLEPDPALPPPAPGNVRAAYDTATGNVRLAWSPVGVSDLDGYLVYRNEASGTDPERINPLLIRDTAYTDQLVDVSDTADLSLVYRVKAQDTHADLSATFSAPVSITVPAPLRIEAGMPDEVFPGDTLAVRGLIRSGIALTSVDVSIWRGIVDVSAGQGFTISSSPLPPGRKSWDLESDARLKIIVDDTVAGTEYTLRIVARAGDRSSSDSLAFALIDDTFDARTLVAGAQAHATAGAFIDLDAFRSHTLVSAMGNAAEIDLVFAFSTSANAPCIYSPYAAKHGVAGGAGFDFVSGLNPANTTEMRRAYANPDSIRTRRQIDSLWNSGTAVPDGRLLLESGTVFLAKSNQGRVVLLQARDLIGAATGTVTLFGKARFE